MNLGALFGMGGKSAGLGNALQQVMGMQQQQAAVGQWDSLRQHLPNLSNYDLGQYADFPELQQMLEAERANSAFEEGGGEGFDARLRALNKLENLSETGMTEQGQLERAQMLQDQGMRDKAARDSILSREQEMAGGMNTGRRLQDQLLASQSGADRRAMGDLGIGAQMEGSRFAALQGVGQMGSGLTADTQRAQQARDMISQFNLQRQDQRDFSNNATANQTLLGRDQRGMQNLDLRNQQQFANNQVAQQRFQNQAGITQGQAGQQANFGNSILQNQQFQSGQQQQANQFAQQQQLANAQAGMGAGAGMATGFQSSDETKKKDIKEADFDVREFLNSLSPYKFSYRNPMDLGASEGTKVGIMAQDIEGTLPGRSMVKDTPDGKMIDVQEAVNPILAALGNINERLERKGI
jgi:hypothetical protein